MSRQLLDSIRPPRGIAGNTTAIGRCLALFAAALAPLTLLSCGYNQQELFPEQLRTVALPIFENRTFYRGVEFDLTEALIKEIELRTPYKVVRTADADTVLQGTITDIDQRRLSRREQGALPQDMETRITIDFEWRDGRSGEVLRQRQGFEAVGRYVPARPVGQTFELSQHEAVQRLARDVVSTMRADW